MLRYYGTKEAFRLGEEAKFYIRLYARAGDKVCLVPFVDLQVGKVKYVRFEWLVDQWLFIDIQNEKG